MGSEGQKGLLQHVVCNRSIFYATDYCSEYIKFKAINIYLYFEIRRKYAS